MEQNFINMLAGAVSVLFGWILKTVWDAVKDLQHADDELCDKVNRIFGVVKEFVANGRDLSDCFGFIGQMTTAKEDLKLKAEKKGFTSDAEEFAALEQIKQAEQELRELMQYYGRAGLWEDFVKFQAEARKARLLERNERIKKINQRWQYASLIVAGVIGFIGMYAIFVVASAVLAG
jgi:hypothetical protein